MLDLLRVSWPWIAGIVGLLYLFYMMHLSGVRADHSVHHSMQLDELVKQAREKEKEHKRLMSEITMIREELFAFRDQSMSLQQRVKMYEQSGLPYDIAAEAARKATGELPGS